MPQWYYTSGNQEIGPVAEEQIRQLVASGKISPDDEVWREGMANWARAGDVPGLLSERTVDPPPPPSGTPRRPRPNISLPPLEAHKLGRMLGIPLLVAGLTLVLLARGCDSLGQRRVERLRAIAQSTPLEFDYYYEMREERLEAEKNRLLERTDRSTRDEQRIDDINEQLVELRETRDKQRAELLRSDWRELRYAAETAEANNRSWGYWREVVFLFGSLLLVAGLLCVAFVSAGAERWVALVLLAIILFSIYGGVWVGAVGRLGT